MTKLPPGFSHELPQHLFEQTPAKDPLTGVPILDFENFCCGTRSRLYALIRDEIMTTLVFQGLTDSRP